MALLVLINLLLTSRAPCNLSNS